MDKELKEKLASFLMKDADTDAEDKEEDKEDDKGEEKKSVEKMKDEIAESISKQVFDKLESDKVAKDSKEKAAKVSEVNIPSVQVKEYEKAIYTKKNGDKITCTKSVSEAIQGWYKSVASRNFDAAETKRLEIDTKFAHLAKNGLEPLNQTVAADGGVLVPTILADFIVEIKEDVAKMRALSNPIDMTSMPGNSLDISKELTNPKVSWSGVEQYDADKSTTSAQFEKQTLTPYTVAAVVAITNQLIADSPFNMIQILSRQLGRAMATEEDRVAINGTGVAQPTGISTYAASSTINAGGNLTFDNLNAA